MSNILTYTLLLNDRMSSTLQKVGASTEQTTKEVNNLDRSVNNLNKVNLSGFFSSISRITGVIGVGTIIGKTIQSGMEQEMRNTSFEVLFGGVDNAKKIIDDISKYAADSPYGKEGLSEAAQMMAGFGIAQDRIIPNLKVIGDIAMGNVNKFNSLSLAFSQMSSTGKLTGQDLLQMINAGFNPLNQISKDTGKSIAQLKEEMGKGNISSQMVTEAFENATKQGGLYHGMIDKISDTTSGQWATATDNISEKTLNLYNNVIQPILLPALKLFNQFLEDPIGTLGRLTDKVTSSYPVISGAIITITTAIITYKTITSAALLVTNAISLATKAWAVVQWILNAAMTANPVGLIIAGVVALIALIAFLIIKIDGWGEAWKHTVNGAKLAWKAYVEYVKSSFNTTIQAIMIGLNKIKEGWYYFKETIGLGDSSENQKFIEQIQKDTEARKKSIIDGQKKTADLLKQSGEEFIKAGKSLKLNDTSFSDVLGGMKKKMGISEAGTSGATNINDELGGNTGKIGNTGRGRNIGKNTANSIATGGTKTTNITVNIGEMGNDMKIYVSSVKEGATNMRDMILDELTRVLAMTQVQVS